MVTVLFARQDSIYKTLPGLDVWDINRDARNWQGGNPVIAHPPCRAWGQMAHFASPRQGERELAIWAVNQVRQWGGVLEHPAQSKLWPTLNLPRQGERDEFGGFSLWVSQFWFGHKADKPTLLYIVGIEPADLPEIPFRLGEPSHVISSTVRKSQPGWKPHVTKADRERTPLELAQWLAETALRISGHNPRFLTPSGVAETGRRDGRDTQEALARLHSGGSLNRSHACTAGGRGSFAAPTGQALSDAESEVVMAIEKLSIKTVGGGAVIDRINVAIATAVANITDFEFPEAGTRTVSVRLKFEAVQSRERQLLTPTVSLKLIEKALPAQFVSINVMTQEAYVQNEEQSDLFDPQSFSFAADFVPTLADLNYGLRSSA